MDAFLVMHRRSYKWFVLFDIINQIINNKKMAKIKNYFLALLLICGASLALYGIVWAAEGTNWDVLNIYSIIDEPSVVYNGFVSMALRSDNYPGVAWMSDFDDSLRFRDCTSGDCATDGGGGISSWNTEITLDDTINLIGEYNAIDYNSDNYAAIIYSGYDTANRTRMAVYVGSGGTGCASGITAWSCFTIDLTDANTEAHTDLSIDGNDRYHGIWNDGYQTLKYGYCDDYASSGCDTAGDYTLYNIFTNKNNQNSRISASSAGLIYTSYDDGSGLYVARCDVATSSCDAAEDWALTTVASGLIYNGDIYVKDADTIGLVFDYSGSLAFAEYVGSGGNCDDSYGGSDAWDCNVFSGTFPFEGEDKWVGATVAYDSSEFPHIIYSDTSTNDAIYYSCDSANCAGTGAGTWTADAVYEGSTGNDFGMMPNIEITSGGDPITTFSSRAIPSYYNVFYGELEQQEEGPTVPEFASYKALILVALAAFGMFIVVMLVYKRNKK